MGFRVRVDWAYVKDLRYANPKGLRATRCQEIVEDEMVAATFGEAYRIAKRQAGWKE